MSELALRLPFFTERDADILYGESTRDPLGLLPVWSTVGHALIPGLATIVDRIDGIQGILFLYACLNELPHHADSQLSDDKVLRFLERLWEYHLYHYRDKKPCFGITSLNGVDFQLSTSLPGIVGTGLRQYYRGTCVNKRIMAGNLRALNEPYASYAKALLTPKLLSWFKTHVGKMGAQNYTASAGVEYEKLRDSLEQFSRGSEPLWQALEKDLIADAGQMHWVQHVVSQHDDWAELPVPHLVQSVRGYAEQQQDSELGLKCQRILDCEPFMQLLECVFLIAQEEGRSSLSALAKKLGDTAPDNLAQVCEQFQRLSFRSRRLENLKDLAERLRAKDYHGFLSRFLDGYYGSVCQERGKNPIVYVDGQDLIALRPGKTGNTWEKSTDPERWRNGYFLKSQIHLYTDLMARRELPRG